MSDDHYPEPSFLLARHETAHREHLHHLQHQHNKLHKRQTDVASTVTATASVVTEVTQTVSVVQEIDVDSNGNTFSIFTVPADATGEALNAVTTNSPVPLTPTAAIPLTTHQAVAALPATASTSPQLNPSPLASQSLSSSQSAAPALTSTPSIPATFASLIVSSNSTTLISSSSSLFPTFSNSSISSSKSSLTYLTSSSSSLFSDFSSTSTSISFPSTSTPSSLQPTSTDFVGVAAGGTGVTPGTATSSAASSGDGSDSNSGSSPSTPAVVGGVVGSIAGVAIIALLFLFIIKWKKRNGNGTLLSLGSGRDVDDHRPDIVPGTGGAPPQPTADMTERRSLAYAVPAALASLTGYKRFSQKTDRTISSTAGSERGFYRVSGRKLPSVIQTGGDGYGGGSPDPHTLSGASFYRDSQGFYGGTGTPTFSPIEIQRDSGIPVMRPSPARTPVTEQGPFPPVPPLDPSLPRRPDVLGRSHPSQDGSHASKFTEEV